MPRPKKNTVIATITPTTDNTSLPAPKPKQISITITKGFVTDIQNVPADTPIHIVYHNPA